MWNHAVETGSESDIATVAPTWVGVEHGGQATGRRSGCSDWRTVDRALRAIRRGRAALDAEEMHWLREAEALQIWRPLGMVSALDYLERALGYAPRTAQDRLRVARALGKLPQLAAALAGDALTFSAVRELCRVATPTTEGAWIAAAAGKNLRQIEELVADHRPGDRPDDPPDPAARTRVVQFELDADTFALLRQARQVLDSEHGTGLDDNALVAALCNAVLDGATGSEPTGRARFQIAVTICARCERGWQEGAGAQVAIDRAAAERARCDAQYIGSLDGAGPERAHQDIPPSTVRFVWRRDGGRCRVPGCRSARGLEVHHVVHRADGGSHDPCNVVLLCSSCHLAHHRGVLTITGTAERLEVTRPGEDAARDRIGNAVVHGLGRTANPLAIAAIGGSVDAHAGTATGSVVRSSARARCEVSVAPTCAAAGAIHELSAAASNRVGIAATNERSITPVGTHVGAVTRLDAAIVRTQAKAALTSLGWKPAIARTAVAAAAAALGTDISLEQLIVESLRRCPMPAG